MGEADLQELVMIAEIPCLYMNTFKCKFALPLMCTQFLLSFKPGISSCQFNRESQTPP